MVLITSCPAVLGPCIQQMRPRNLKELCALVDFIYEHQQHGDDFVVWCYGKRSVKVTVFGEGYLEIPGTKPREYNFNFRKQRVTEKNSDGRTPVGYVEIPVGHPEDFELRFNFRELNGLLRRVGRIDFCHLRPLLRVYLSVSN